jgi:hypothetical protein
MIISPHGNSFFGYIKIDTLFGMFNAVLSIELMISSISSRTSNCVAILHDQAFREDELKEKLHGKFLGKKTKSRLQSYDCSQTFMPA